MKTLREPGDFFLWKKIWGKINSMTRYGGKEKKIKLSLMKRERKVKKSFEKRKGITNSKIIRNQGS